MPLLVVLAIGGFVSSFSIRLIDPIVPAIARDLAVTIESVALLVSAYAVPYAFGQPVLGTLGDALGKTRVIKLCLLAQVLSMALAAASPNYTVLLVVRLVGGFMSGAIIPLTFAIIGDRFTMAERQLALSRVLMAILLGQISGAAGSGLIAAALGWRAVLALSAGMAAAALLAMMWSLPPRRGVERKLPSVTELKATYARILSHPRAKACYVGVAVEGIVIFGMMPYVAALLEQRGTGGILYTLGTAVLLRLLGTYDMMRSGGVLAAIGLAIIGWSHGWYGQLAGFAVMGYGFFMLHNGIQTQVTELVPEARGAAVALHAFFYFLGQAVGPVLYGIGVARLGARASCLIAASIAAGLGFWVAARVKVSA